MQMETHMTGFNEIEMMLKLGAAYNCGSNDVDAMDADDAAFCADDVVKTHQDVADFTSSSPKITANGIKFYVREDFQISKGLRRGYLFIADFGDFRAVAFTGEGVIKAA